MSKNEMGQIGSRKEQGSLFMLSRKSIVISLTSLSLLILGFFQNCAPINFIPYEKSLGSLSEPPVCRELTAEEVKPKLKWDWYAQLDVTDPSNFPKFSQVMATPMVADLNGDGVPEVVFVSWSVSGDWFPDNDPKTSYYGRNGVLRIVDGKTGKNLKSVGDQELAPYATTSPLLVDLDADGKMEIVYSHYLGRKVIALNHDGSKRWIYDSPTYVANASSFSAADFNRDGRAEVVLGQKVLTENSSRNPEVLFTLSSTTSSPYQFAYSLNPNKPKELQILGTNGVFNGIGEFQFPLPAGMLYAAADLDKTRTGIEIVATGGGKLKIFDGIQGDLLKSYDLTTVSELKCASGSVGGGTPTVGDFDGDPSTLEIAVATGKYLAIFTQDAKLLMKYETQDCSSLATGISSFDFNGDGKPEILYADEEYLRIFEIRNGELHVVSKIVNPSGTIYEYPVVVDVDGNGSSEIVVASNNYPVGSFYRDADEVQDQAAAYLVTGVRAFEATVEGSWMPTRKIWNQFEYNPALVSERGLASSFTPTAKDFFTTNIFRRNTQLGLFETKCKSN